jgi:hypothetical protein
MLSRSDSNSGIASASQNMTATAIAPPTPRSAVLVLVLVLIVLVLRKSLLRDPSPGLLRPGRGKGAPLGAGRLRPNPCGVRGDSGTDLGSLPFASVHHSIHFLALHQRP